MAGALSRQFSFRRRGVPVIGYSSTQKRVGGVLSEEEPPPRPPWLLPVVIGVGGFALGLLVATTIGSQGPSEASPTLPPAPSSTSTTTGEVEPSTSVSTTAQINEEPGLSLEELVPGFEGTLYFTNPTSSSALDRRIVAWSSERSMPFQVGLRAGFPTLDVSGSLMAFVAGQSLDTPFPGATISIVRNLDRSRPLPQDPDGYVGAAVTWFVWHASEPGLLAWIEFDLDRSVVKTAEFSNLEQLVRSTIVAEFEGVAWPVYWDDDIFIVAAQSESLELVDGQSTTGRAEVRTFNSEWDPIGTTLGEFVGRLPTGELIIADDVSRQTGSGPFLTDETLQDRRDPEWLPEGSRLRSVIATPGGGTVWVSGENQDGTPFLGRLEGPSVDRCAEMGAVAFFYTSTDGDWLVYQDVDETGKSLWFVNAVTCGSTRVDVPPGAGFLVAIGS